MEWLTFLLLGIGLMFLMSRGHGGMGCCGGRHGNHHSQTQDDKHTHPKGFAEPKDNDVIDLREDEYELITNRDDSPPSS